MSGIKSAPTKSAAATTKQSSNHIVPSAGADLKGRITDAERAAADYLATISNVDEREAATGRIVGLVRAKTPPEDARPRLRFELDLAEIAAGGIPDPPRLSTRLYENRVHWYSGHPGHGKTTMAAADAVAHMATGGHVVWLDFEAGKRQTVARLMAAGATVEQLGAQFHLAVSPPMTADENGLAPLAAALEEWPGALLAIDSASKALGAAGLDENNPTDVTKWTTHIVIPSRELGATVIVIDHVTKGATKFMPYARGAGSKLADTDVAWYVEATERFDRETSGRVELTRQKDREGLLPESLAYAVGDGAGKLPVVQVDVETEGTRTEREAGMRGKVLAVLQEHSDAAHPIKASQVIDRISGREKAIRDALRELAGDKSAPVVTADGPNRSVLYAYDPAAAKALSVVDNGGLGV
jgi:AAA domain